MKFKRIAVVASLLASLNLIASEIDVTDEKLRKAYELGHFHGVTQVSREFDLEMFNKYKGGLELKRYLVAMDITKIPIHKILLYKTYALSEGLSPITTKNSLLIFASFKRKVDAEYLVNGVLNPGYFGANDTTKIMVIDNVAGEKYSYAPFVYNELMGKMEKDIKDKVKAKVFVLNPNISDKVVVKPKKMKRAAPIKKSKPLDKKYFQIKYKIPYYEFKVGTAKELRNILKKDIPFNEDRLIEKGYLTNISKKYAFLNTAISKDDIRYVKVLNKNIWVELEDVKVLTK